MEIERSNHWQMFFKIGILKNFQLGSRFNNVYYNFFKKETPTQVFSCESS